MQNCMIKKYQIPSKGDHRRTDDNQKFERPIPEPTTTDGKKGQQQEQRDRQGDERSA